MNYPDYVFEENTLREVLIDKEYVTKWCNENLDQPIVVSYLRMLGCLAEAKQYGLKFVDEALEEPQRLSALVRFATVLHWNNEYLESEKIYLECIHKYKQRNEPKMEAFAHQHLAKLYIDTKELEKAFNPAQKAYELRSIYDSQNLSSTQLILNYINNNKLTINK